MGRRRTVSVPMSWEPPPPREKTVILDQFGTGATWGYEREDNRLCSGEIVETPRDESWSSERAWRNRWGW